MELLFDFGFSGVARFSSVRLDSIWYDRRLQVNCIITCFVIPYFIFIVVAAAVGRIISS